MKTRTLSLDSFKAICAFMIIFLHYGVVDSGLINCYFRIAVPFFFLVSGYFLYDSDNGICMKRCQKHIKKLVIINAAVLVCLLLKDFLASTVKGESINLALFLDPQFILFNFKYASYLWFVRALIYIYLIYLAVLSFVPVNKAVKEMVFGLLAAFFIILSLLLCKYSALLGLSIPPEAYEIPCKFVGCAFSCFTIGYLIAKNSVLVKKIKANILLFLLAIFIVSGGGRNITF